MSEFDFHGHFASLTGSCPAQFAFRGASAGDVREWQPPFRARLREILGLANLEQDLAGFVPTAKMLDSLDMGSYIRESWRIRTEPTVPLPFYLLRPKSAPPNPPLVLTPHGHGHPHIYVGLFRNAQGGGGDPRRRARHRRAGGRAGLPGDRSHHACLRRDPLAGRQG